MQPKDSKYVSVETYAFYQIMAHILEGGVFEEDWYLEAYPDVAVSVKSGFVDSAHQHYIRYGYYENRLYHRIVVSENLYIDKNKGMRNEIIQTIYFFSGR